MDVSRMARRMSPYEHAKREHARRQVEKTLVCPQCEYRNRPGAIRIDIDECDDARCQECDFVWQVRLDA